MKKFVAQKWATVKGVLAFFKVVRDPADALDEVFELSAKLAVPEVLGRIGDFVAERSPVARDALDEKPRVDLKALLTAPAAFPEGSLGREFAEFARARGIDPAAIPTLPAGNREEFVIAHLYETHDLWHVLCGFDTDTAGELGLQAFYVAQMPLPLPLVLIAAGLINSALFAEGEKDRRMSEILRGWQMGRKARLLFGVDWKSYWTTPLLEVRQKFALA